MDADAGPGVLRVERLYGSETEAEAVVGPVLRDYIPWAAGELARLGVRFDDTDATVERHHAAFRAELPKLLGERGRLLVARLDGKAVGLGALKPVSDSTAEIKRMYVSGQQQGHGVGRAVLERLLADARAEGYTCARLETLVFMTAAHNLYRSLGFRDTAAFDGSEAALSGLEALTLYRELDLAARL